MAPIRDGSKDMPADCKPYYYIGNSGNVKENFIFFVPAAECRSLSAGNVVYNESEKLGGNTR